MLKIIERSQVANIRRNYARSNDRAMLSDCAVGVGAGTEKNEQRKYGGSWSGMMS